MNDQTRPNRWLQDHRKNVHSQCGEDGVLEAIFGVIGNGDRTAVEFGAWDGKYLSNTRALVEKGWTGVLVEGDAGRFGDLRRAASGNDRIIPIHAFVDFNGPTRLDALLARTSIAKDFSLLSIDIDGNDLHVWEALRNYEPRVVVVEFNPTIPVDIEFVQPRDMRVSQGSSLLAFVNLAKRKGYEFVATTDWNAFFVRRQDFAAFGIRDNSAAAIHDGRKYETRLFQLFDGTVVLDGNRRMMWHGTRLTDDLVQPLPRIFREPTPNMSRAKRVAWRLAKRFLSRFKPAPSDSATTG